MAKKKKDLKKYYIIAGVVLVVLLIWGLVGGNIAKDVGNTCTFGIGDFLCWFWERNAIGEIADAASKYFN